MTRPLALLAALVTAAVAGPALAEEGPSFDCAGVTGEVETLICEDPDLAALDRRLAARYEAALTVVDRLGAGTEEAENELRATQRGWIGGRDDCWKSEDADTCIEDAYLRREAELVARYMLEEPFNTVTWICDGNPANEVVTMFFHTPLESLRFERGDTVDVGTIVRTASGAKYDGSFGRSIWMKGDNAMYREADPDGTEYDCTVAK
ncbi:hypothetical protein DLJ53_19775 [Acuticoccus sediminis]|uniref:Lysozyme inhibitor LprI N-terminal domain-containing protein n=1 Tax=Acuticoccus sediminis TaxID=2184697 RepID=A0A8B2NK20_9HYPH|nr:MliC family protein [Acuticoccus sediminis]RAH99974.1 hypothetical protein DLJ53_19775 [Acuticoccus sediminis]